MDGPRISFKYDPFGRRIEKISPTTTSIFAYDGQNLVEETNSSGAVAARYSQGLNVDEPLAMLRGGATSYYDADGLGTITSLSNAAGAVVQSYAYDSYGKQTASYGSLTTPFRYTAREFDSETNLYYYRARYYDLTVGRFLSEDPIGFNGGDVNFFTYAANSPVNFYDPSGNRIVLAGDATSWDIARLYLCTSPAVCSAIEELENAPDAYVINISDEYDVDQAYGPWKVFWNPHKGLCVKKGAQSPALQLLHELTHLLQMKHGKSFSAKDSSQREEEAVQATNPAARQLGEPTRLNYADAHGNPTFPSPIPGSGKVKCPCE